MVVRAYRIGHMGHTDFYTLLYAAVFYVLHKNLMFGGNKIPGSVSVAHTNSLNSVVF